MEIALNENNIKTTQIDYINAHGTLNLLMIKMKQRQ